MMCREPIHACICFNLCLPGDLSHRRAVSAFVRFPLLFFLFRSVLSSLSWAISAPSRGFVQFERNLSRFCFFFCLFSGLEAFAEKFDVAESGVIVGDFVAFRAFDFPL